jgi:hypothetical protein
MSSGKVKCTCGWSWNKSDSSKKDMYICHECGRDNSNNMKNGGWLDNYNDSETSVPEGYVGEGYSTKGRNYSPAWGGQFEDGGSVYPVNYVPQAQWGLPVGPFTPIAPFAISAANKVKSWFSDDEQPAKKPGAKSNTRTLNIVDPRKKMATTNQPLRPNSDLVGGKYSSRHLDKLMQEAKRQGLSKQDMMNLSAMGFQETKWGRTDDNIGHVLGNWKGNDSYQQFISAYKEKMKEADRLGIKDPALRLQVYNGLGTVTPKTEKNYHGFEMQKIYGVPIPKGGINMKKNPLYGKQVMDIRDNVLAKNPEYVQYMDSIYKAPVPAYMQDVRMNKQKPPKNIQGRPQLAHQILTLLKKKEMGGSIPGTPGFTYARTINPAPDNGPGAKKTLSSAQDGVETWKKQQELVKKEKAGKLKKLLENPPVFKKKTLDEKIAEKIQQEKYRTVPKDNTVVRNYNNADKFSKTARNKTDKEIADERKAIRKKSDANVLNQYSTEIFDTDNWTRQNLSDAALGLESKFRVSDEPNFFDNWLNPFNMVGNMASNLGQAPLQAEQTDSYMPYVTAIGTPLTVGALAGLGTNSTGQFVNNLTNPVAGLNVGKFLTTKTPLKEAWRLNPKAYQYNLPENTMWRGLGKQGMEDAVSSGLFRSKQNVAAEYFPGSTLRLDKSFGINPYFTPKFKTAATYGDNFLAEVPRDAANWRNRYARTDWSQVADRPIPIDQGRLLQKDWWQGYKPLEVPTNSLPGRENVFNNIISPRNILVDEQYMGNDAMLNALDDVKSTSLPSKTKLNELREAVDDGELWKYSDINPADEIERLKKAAKTEADIAYINALEKQYDKNVRWHDASRNRANPVFLTGQSIEDLVNPAFKNPEGDQWFAMQPFKYTAPKGKNLGYIADEADYIHNTKYRLPGNRWDTEAMLRDMGESANESFNSMYKPLNVNIKDIPLNKNGGVTKDNMGYWNPDNWDGPVEIGSNEITMRDVPFDVLGISDEGDVQYMKSDNPKNYKFKGKKVTEFRMAKNGLRQEQKGLVNLDQLTNFTNYNTKQPGGWLDKY